MSMLNDFKKFAMLGNVLDLAVAVIIGASFGNIVTSFVNDILMPPIGVLLGGADFTDFAITLREATGDLEAVTINYGVFIQYVVDFTIIACAIFMVGRSFERLKGKEEEAPAAPAERSKEENVLTGMRDLLKKQS